MASSLSAIVVRGGSQPTQPVGGYVLSYVSRKHQSCTLYAAKHVTLEKVPNIQTRLGRVFLPSLAAKARVRGNGGQDVEATRVSLLVFLAEGDHQHRQYLTPSAHSSAPARTPMEPRNLFS